jgi:hypothetical protein
VASFLENQKLFIKRGNGNELIEDKKKNFFLENEDLKMCNFPYFAMGN